MLDVRIKVRLRLYDAHCPSCSSNNLRPGLIRPWVENIFIRTWLLVTLRRPYLCRDCDTRFYDLRYKARHMIAAEPEIEAILKEYMDSSASSTPANASETESPKKDLTA